MKRRRSLFALILAVLTAVVVTGCVQTIPQVPCRDPNCQLCRGHGNYRCSLCFGRGSKQCNICNGRGMTGGVGAAATKCWTCSGTGLANCTTCSGSGMKQCTKPAPGYGAPTTGYAPQPAGYRQPAPAPAPGGYGYPPAGGYQAPPAGYQPAPTYRTY